jgi:DNA-binding NarL/FixJ family response regulator
LNENEMHSPHSRSDDTEGRRRLFDHELPLVGRESELAELDRFLQQPGGQRVAIVYGPGGVGKTRLASTLCAEAASRGWTVAKGQAYPVESGVAYGLFSDAFMPLFDELPEGALSGLTRGGEAELGYLFPSLTAGSQGVPSADWTNPGEFKTRLFWNFTEFLKGYADREPLLVHLEDLQWADETSLELLHFVARHLEPHQIRFLCTYNEELTSERHGLARTAGSLWAQGYALRLHMEPLSLEAVAELVRRVFTVEEVVNRDLVRRLHTWTHGNPLFIRETLRELVESGRLYMRDGIWLGWEDTQLELPGSLREGVLAGLVRLSPEARKVADRVAVVGGPVSHAVLDRLTGPEINLVEAIDELLPHQVLTERLDGSLIMYDFAHPLTREALYGDLSLARARRLHAQVVEAVEAVLGDRVMERAGQLAYHLVRSGKRDLTEKALLYLTSAGHDALERHADVDAANYLETALTLIADGRPTAGTDAPEVAEVAVLSDLAHARQRQGRYDDATDLWTRCLEAAPAGTPSKHAVLRHMGLACYWSGRHREAIQHFENGLAALPPGDEHAAAAIRLARGVCYQELGSPDAAKEDIESALAAAERAADVPLLARAHRALALLHTFTGPPDVARTHAHRAAELAEDCGDRNVAFWSHWVLAALEGLTGDTETMAVQLKEARRVSDELGSPVLSLWADELSVERAYATGEWDTGVALGEQAIALARSLGQNTLLPRLLVWTSFIYLGRGDLTRGHGMVQEAWALAGLDDEDRPIDVHTAVPAHIGVAAYHLFADEREEAIAVAQRGLEITDRSGYVIWAIHHMLPIMAEALIHTRDLAQAKQVGERLRRDSERLQHPLGLAWADACDAFVVWLNGDLEGGAALLRTAAEALEAIPIVPEATRIRRQLAARLADLGDREAALKELRQAHEASALLGMSRELSKARALFRQLEARPPLLTNLPGVGELTARETDVAQLVAKGQSNKSIAKELDVSLRTVTTHLQNIYRKVDVGSRHELAEWMRHSKLQR